MHRTYEKLKRLNDRELADIGLTRDDLDVHDPRAVSTVCAAMGAAVQRTATRARPKQRRRAKGRRHEPLH